VTSQKFADDVASITAELAEVLEQMPVADVPRSFVDLALFLGEVVDQHPDRITATYCSVDWWGGAGSMADLSLPDKDANQSRHRLLADLVDTFESAGYSCPRARQWRDTFRHWLKSGAK